MLYLLFGSICVVLFFTRATLLSMDFGQNNDILCVEVIDEQDGLSDNSVFCMLQDSYGIMWFGTRDGLSRYDGHRITTFRHNPRDTASLGSVSILQMCEGKNGLLWLGLSSGSIDCFDRKTQQFRHFTCTAEGMVRNMCVDRDGNVWVILSKVGRKLLRLDYRTGEYSAYTFDSKNHASLSSDRPSGVCMDSTGTVWVATENAGINRYDAIHDCFVNFRTVPEYGLQNTGLLSGIRADANGILWLYDVNEEVRRMYTASGGFYVDVFGPAPTMKRRSNQVSSLLVDAKGNIWVSTLAQGLYIVNPTSKKYHWYRHEPTNSLSLVSNRIWQLYSDRYQNIWVCTDKGVCKINHNTHLFTHILYDANRTTGLASEWTRSVLKEKGDTLWIGTEQGLYQWDGSHFLHYKAARPHQDNFTDNIINTLYRTRRGELLLGTNQGMYVLDRKNNCYRRTCAILGDDVRIRIIYEDEEENLWVGTLRQGMIKINRQRDKKQFFFEGLSDPSLGSGYGVFAIKEFEKGYLWIGGSNGIYHLNKKTLSAEHYQHDKSDSTSLAYNHVWSLCKMRNGHIAIGTSGGGVDIFNPTTKQFRHCFDSDGLPSNNVCGLLEDDNGTIWISTGRGLAQMDTSGKIIQSFGISDGVCISEYHLGTYWKDDQGHLYFGGRGGLIAFDPKRITRNTSPLPPSIISFKVFSRPLLFDIRSTAPASICLPSDSNFFSIDFAMPNMSNPVKNKYRYQLVGVDEEWRETDGKNASASYTNVRHGKYVFMLQGCSANGLWRDAGSILFIEVEPRWWQIWWVQALAALAVIAAGTVIVLRRLREQRKRIITNKRMMEFQLQALRAQINPHFVFNALSSILHFIMTNKKEEAQLYLTKFSRFIRSVLENSQHDYMALSDEIEMLQWYLELESMRFAGKISFAINVAPSLDSYNMEIPTMLIQPFVENSVKHGLIHTRTDGRIDITFYREGLHLVCTIVDNGIGLPSVERKQEKGLHVSRGIRLIKSRLAMLQKLEEKEYTLAIRNRTESDGTIVELRLPIFVDESIDD